MKKLTNILLASFLLSFQSFSQDCYPVVDLEQSFLLSSQDCDYSSHANSLTGGETYKLYTLKGYFGTGEGEEPQTYEGPCEEQLYVNVLYEEKDQSPVIGIRADYDPFPKVLKVQDVNSETYKKITADVLKKEGLENPNVKVTQLVRTDIEGDGVEEVVICASYFKVDDKFTVSAGDYSIIFYRKIIKGQVQNIVLEKVIYPVADQGSIQYFVNLKAILDVNGDGKMEIIVGSGYYEGNSTNVYEIDGEESTIILSAGCGA